MCVSIPPRCSASTLRAPVPQLCDAVGAVTVRVLDALERVRLPSVCGTRSACAVLRLPLFPVPHPHGAGDYAIQYVLHGRWDDVMSNPCTDLSNFEPVLFFAEVTVRATEVVAFVLPIKSARHPPFFRGQQAVVVF